MKLVNKRKEEGYKSLYERNRIRGGIKEEEDGLLRKRIPPSSGTSLVPREHSENAPWERGFHYHSNAFSYMYVSLVIIYYGTTLGSILVISFCFGHGLF